jgi:hypothetical protein
MAPEPYPGLRHDETGGRCSEAHFPSGRAEAFLTPHEPRCLQSTERDPVVHSPPWLPPRAIHVRRDEYQPEQRRYFTTKPASTGSATPVT